MKHVVENNEMWLAYINSKDSDNLSMPGPYIEFDPVKEERLKKMKKASRNQQMGGGSKPKKNRALEEINEEEDNGSLEEDQSEEQLIPEEEIWHLDDEDSEETANKTNDLDGGVSDSSEGPALETLIKTKTTVAKQSEPKDKEIEYIDEREMVADSIVTGVSDY